eukprot:Opistho-2@63037
MANPGIDQVRVTYCRRSLVPASVKSSPSRSDSGFSQSEESSIASNGDWTVVGDNLSFPEVLNRPISAQPQQPTHKTRGGRCSMPYHRTSKEAHASSFYAAAVYHLNELAAESDSGAGLYTIQRLIETAHHAVSRHSPELLRQLQDANVVGLEATLDVASIIALDGPSAPIHLHLLGAALATITTGVPWTITVNDESWTYLIGEKTCDERRILWLSRDIVECVASSFPNPSTFQQRGLTLLSRLVKAETYDEDADVLGRLMVGAIGVVPIEITTTPSPKNNLKYLMRCRNWDGQILACFRGRFAKAGHGDKQKGKAPMSMINRFDDVANDWASLSSPVSQKALLLWNDAFTLVARSSGENVLTKTKIANGISYVSADVQRFDLGTTIPSLEDVRANLGLLPRVAMWGSAASVKPKGTFDVERFVETFAEVITETVSSLETRDSTNGQFHSESFIRSASQRSRDWSTKFFEEINRFVQSIYDEAGDERQKKLDEKVGAAQKSALERAKLPPSERGSMTTLTAILRQSTPSNRLYERLLREAYDRFCDQSATLAVVNAFFLRTCVGFGLLTDDDICLLDVLKSSVRASLLDTIRENVTGKLTQIFSDSSASGAPVLAWLDPNCAYTWLFLPPIAELRTLWTGMEGFDLGDLHSQLAAGVSDTETDILSAVFQKLLEMDKAKVRTFGKVYTPRPLVHFVLRAAGIDAGPEAIENDVLADSFEYLLDQSDEVQYLTAVRSVLDPAAGSGGFLAYYVAVVVSKLRRCDGVWNNSVRLERALKAIADNVWGVEIDFVAWEISLINLLTQILPIVRRLQELRGDGTPVSIPKFNIYHGNTLRLFKDNLYADNATKRAEMRAKLWESQLTKYRRFDFVLGNPPYTRRQYSSSAFDGVDDENYDEKKSPWSLLGDKSVYGRRGLNWKSEQRTAQLHLFFFLFGAIRLKNGGKLAFVSPPTFLSSPYDIGFKQHLLSFVIPETLFIAPRFVFFAEQTEVMVTVCRHAEDRGRRPMSAAFHVLLDRVHLMDSFDRQNMRNGLGIWDEICAMRDDYAARAEKSGIFRNSRFFVSLIPADVLYDSHDPSCKEEERDVMAGFLKPGVFGARTPEDIMKAVDGVQPLTAIAPQVGRGVNTGADAFLTFTSTDKFVALVAKLGKKLTFSPQDAKKNHDDFLRIVGSEGYLRRCHFEKDERSHYIAPDVPGFIIECYLKEQAPASNTVTRKYLEYASIAATSISGGKLKVSATDANAKLALWMAEAKLDIREAKESTRKGQGKPSGDTRHAYLTLGSNPKVDWNPPYFLVSHFAYFRVSSPNRCIQFMLVSEAGHAKNNFVYVSPPKSGHWAGSYALLALLNSLPVEAFIIRVLGKGKQVDTKSVTADAMGTLPVPPGNDNMKREFSHLGAILTTLYERLRGVPAVKENKRKDLLMLRCSGAGFRVSVPGKALTFCEFLSSLTPEEHCSALVKTVKDVEKGDSSDLTPLQALAPDISFEKDEEAGKADGANFLADCFDREATLGNMLHASAILDIVSRLEALVDALAFKAYGFTAAEVSNTWDLLGYRLPQSVRIHLQRAYPTEIQSDPAFRGLQLARHIETEATQYSQSGTFLGLSLSGNNVSELVDRLVAASTKPVSLPKPARTPESVVVNKRGTSSRKRKGPKPSDSRAAKRTRLMFDTEEGSDRDQDEPIPMME